MANPFFYASKIRHTFWDSIGLFIFQRMKGVKGLGVKYLQSYLVGNLEFFLTVFFFPQLIERFVNLQNFLSRGII